jgi:Ca2+/Na+ antiporter
MFVLLNGAVGYWDELAIALLALAVLWVAVKLAGRNPARDEDEDEQDPATLEAEERHDEPPAESSKKSS